MRRFFTVAFLGLLGFSGLSVAGRLELRYDDGTPEVSYYGLPGDAYGVKFTAPIYPCTLLAARFFITDSGDPTVPFQVVILGDGGPGGAPGCTLAMVDFVSADSGDVWVEVELPDTVSLLFIDSTSFYVAIYWYVPYDPSLGGDFQFSGGDTLSWRLYSGTWYNLGGLVDLMIRAIVSHPDSLPPSFSATTVLGDTNSCGPFPVSSVITDDWVGVDPQAGHLFWRTLTAPWDSVNMLDVGGDTFLAETPKLPEGDSVWYYLRASDLAGNTSTDPANAPDTSFSFLIVAEPPQFSSTTIWPDTSFPGSYPVLTQVWDAGAGLDTTQIRLYWCFDGGVWSDTVMTWFSGAQTGFGHIPQVPEPAETTLVSYYIEAFDWIGLRGTDPEGAPQDSTYHFVYTPAVGVELQDAGSQRSEARLLDNFPNPFAHTTTISFTVNREPCNVSLAVYDLGGRLIKTLVEGGQSVTGYESPVAVSWDGRDYTGRKVSAGIYFYRLCASGPALPFVPSLRVEGSGAEVFVCTKKLVILR